MEVVGRLKVLEESAAPLISFLQNPALVQELRADKHYNLQMLQDRYQVLSPSLKRFPFLGLRYSQVEDTCANSGYGLPSVVQGLMVYLAKLYRCLLWSILITVA